MTAYAVNVIISLVNKADCPKGGKAVTMKITKEIVAKTIMAQSQIGVPYDETQGYCMSFYFSRGGTTAFIDVDKEDLKKWKALDKYGDYDTDFESLDNKYFMEICEILANDYNSQNFDDLDDELDFAEDQFHRCFMSYESLYKEDSIKDFIWQCQGEGYTEEEALKMYKDALKEELPSNAFIERTIKKMSQEEREKLFNISGVSTEDDLVSKVSELELCYGSCNFENMIKGLDSKLK